MFLEAEIYYFDNIDGVTHDEMRKGKINPGYENVNMHMIFYIKMDRKFTIKEILVDEGHKKAPTSPFTYSSVVYRESVRIAFILASLNNLDIFAYDIGNSYLNDKCIEKLWTESGTEFGTEKGMAMIIERALYLLKISGSAWGSKLAENLMSIG